MDKTTTQSNKTRNYEKYVINKYVVDIPYVGDVDIQVRLLNT